MCFIFAIGVIQITPNIQMLVVFYYVRLRFGQIGVSTNVAAAKVMSFDRLGKQVRPGTSGNIKVG